MTGYYLIPLIETLIYFSLLTVVAVNRPWQRVHKLFVMYLVSAAVWGFTNYLLLSSYFADAKLLIFKLVIISSMWMAAQLFYFAMSFLNLPGGFGMRFGYVALVVLIILSALGYAPQSIVVENGMFIGPVYGWWFIPYLLPMAILAGLGVRQLVMRLRIISDPRERNKVFYLIIAVVLLVGFGFLGMAPLTVAGGLPVSHIGALLSACVLTYAVIKHELVSINAVLRRGLGLTSLFIVGIGVYMLVLYFLGVVTGQDFTVATIAIATASAFVVALLVYWIRPIFFTIVDQFFYRETYTYRLMLQRFDREMGNIISLDELADRMLSTIARALRNQQAKLLFQNVGSGDYTTQYVYPPANAPLTDEPRFAPDNPIVTWLEKETNPLYLHEIESIAQFEGLWQTERELLNNSNLELFCPIKSRGKLIGILALGKNKSSSSYSQEDIEMIISMANKAGIIIENARMFNTLRQQQHQVQELLSEAIHAQESERQRISIDLHDSVAQWLAGASYQAQTVDALLSRENNSELRDELAVVEDTIERSLKELRRVVVDLRPPALDELGLSHALRQSLMTLSSDGITCKFNEDGAQTRLPPSVEITVYRAVQEALTNIRKHAEATKVELSIQFQEENVVVKVRDNGKGFDLGSTIENAVNVGNMGLLGMEQRVGMVGGTMSVRTRKGGGTTITMTLPVQQQVEGN